MEQWQRSIEAIKEAIPNLGNMQYPSEDAANYLPDAVRIIKRFYPEANRKILINFVFEAAFQLSDEDHQQLLRHGDIEAAFGLCIQRQSLRIIIQPNSIDRVEIGRKAKTKAPAFTIDVWPWRTLNEQRKSDVVAQLAKFMPRKTAYTLLKKCEASDDNKTIVKIKLSPAVTALNKKRAKTK